MALRECRPDMNECIATDSRCSMQKTAKHCRLPSATALHVTIARMHTEPFQDKFWPQQVAQVPHAVHTTTGSMIQRKYIRDLDDSLKQAVHDKHKTKVHSLPSMGSTTAPKSRGMQ